MREHLLEAGAPAHALGGRPYLQRPQVVPADHAVALRQASREGRVPLRRCLLPPGGTVRRRNRQLASFRARVPGAHPWMDGGARMVAHLLERLRVAADEYVRADPRLCSSAGHARCCRYLGADFSVSVVTCL